MSVYAEHNVKTKAMSLFLNLIVANNKTLGSLLTEHRDTAYPVAIVHIQRIGIHDYAKLVLKRNSEERIELIEAIKGELQNA